MGSKAKSSSIKEKLLAQILKQFDSQDKENLAVQLVQSLKIEQHGPSYSAQVRGSLGRDLTEEEKFKIDVFERILSFHARRGEGKSVSE